MTKSTQKKKVKKLRFQTKAEKLVAEGGLYVPAPSRETWTSRMITAFNGSYNEGMEAKLTWKVSQRMGYFGVMEEQNREFEEERKKKRKVSEMIRGIKDDFASGKISPGNKKRTIDTLPAPSVSSTFRGSS